MEPDAGQRIENVLQRLVEDATEIWSARNKPGRSCSTSFSFSLKKRRQPSFSPSGTIGSFSSRSTASLTLFGHGAAVDRRMHQGGDVVAPTPAGCREFGEPPRSCRRPGRARRRGNGCRTLSTAWCTEGKARRMSLSRASYSVTVVASHPTSLSATGFSEPAPSTRMSWITLIAERRPMPPVDLARAPSRCSRISKCAGRKG